MHWSFMTKAETNDIAVCALCKKTLTEWYMLYGDSKEEDDILTKTVGREYGLWIVGDCCFGGYCFRPTAFLYEVLLMRRKRRKKSLES